MNRDAAWADLHDPATTAARLAEIAQQYPEFAEAIARHPNSYDELRAWAVACRPANGTEPVRGAAAASTIPAEASLPGASADRASSTRPSGSLRTLMTRKPVLIAAGAVVALVIGGGVWAATASGGGGSQASAGSADPAAPAAAESSPAPLVCPTMAPRWVAGSSQNATSAPVQAAIGPDASRADLIATLTPISKDAADLANKAVALPSGIVKGLDALRATMFTSPKSLPLFRTIDRELAEQCGGHLVADLNVLISQVPTKTGDRVTHTEDTFGVCASGATSLGWSGSTQAFRCQGGVMAIDYAKHALSSYTIPTTGAAKNATTVEPTLTGDRVVWTQTTEKDQPGLTQPLFTGTLYSWAMTSKPPQTTAVFTDQAEAVTPEFFVLAAGSGFAVVGGRPEGSVSSSNGATAQAALYDVRGNAPKKVDVSLPPYEYDSGTSGFWQMNGALVPIWRTGEDTSVYLDTNAAKVRTGAQLSGQIDDAGCRQVLAAKDPADNGVLHSGDTWSERYVVLVRTSTGLASGQPTIQLSHLINPIGVGRAGFLVKDEGRNGDPDVIRAVGFDGSAEWSIASTVATMDTRLLGRILMTNASGQPVVVDESTGKEVTDPKDEVAVLMRTVVAEEPGRSSNSGKFAVIQAGDEVVFTGTSQAEGTVALLLTRSAVCPAVTVPSPTIPLDQLLPPVG